jgi:hypothetical protein
MYIQEMAIEQEWYRYLAAFRQNADAKTKQDEPKEQIQREVEAEKQSRHAA